MFKDIRLSVVDSKSVEINTKCKVEFIMLTQS